MELPDFSNPFKVKNPANPTRIEKQILLNGFFQKCFLAEEFKFAALVAAVRNDEYKNELSSFHNGLVRAFGGNDVDTVRKLILDVPSLGSIWARLKRNLGQKIDGKHLDLIFWNSIIFPDIIEEPVTDFMDKLRAIEGREHPRPKYVLRVQGGREKFMQVLDFYKIIPEVGYFRCSLDEAYKILIKGFSTAISPVLLRREFEPKANTSNCNWEKSDFFKKVNCIGICSFIPVLGKTVLNKTPAGSYFEVHDHELLYLKYFIFYGDDIDYTST